MEKRQEQTFNRRGYTEGQGTYGGTFGIIREMHVGPHGITLCSYESGESEIQ